MVALALTTEARERPERPAEGGSGCLAALYRAETTLRRDGVTRCSCRTLLDALFALGRQAGRLNRRGTTGCAPSQLRNHGGLAVTRAR